MNTDFPPTVLILCTGNSCRSHLAEGILRQAAGDLLDVQSAGSNPAGYVHPLAIKAMAEIGIDLAGHHSKHLNGFLAQDVETVITVCGNADQAWYTLVERPAQPREVRSPRFRRDGLERSMDHDQFGIESPRLVELGLQGGDGPNPDRFVGRGEIMPGAV